MTDDGSKRVTRFPPLPEVPPGAWEERLNDWPAPMTDDGSKRDPWQWIHDEIGLSWDDVNAIAAVLHDAYVALPATPDPRLHPDDGHDHSWGCRRCGVDKPPATPDPTVGREALALIRALDHCDPRYEGGSPNPTNGGPTAFSGWYVPDYLMQRIRAALAAALSPTPGDGLAVWDDPQLDGTEGAHPAWWRGCDYGYALGRANQAELDVESAGTLNVMRLALAISAADDGDRRRPSARLMAELMDRATVLAAEYARLTRERAEGDVT